MAVEESVKEGLLSVQIATMLRREMEDGQYAKETYLPAEMELAERLGVSRTVLRDALSCLEREGLIERCRGVGTTIHHHIVRLKNRLDLKVEYADMLRAKGYTPEIDCVSITVEEADDTLAKRLDLPCGAPVILRKKRVLAAGKPVLYSMDHLSRRLIDKENLLEVDWSKPIFSILQHHCGLGIQTCITEIRAVLGDKDLRERLAVQSDQALLELRELGCSRKGRPVLSTTTYYTDFFTFSLLRKKL